jgi:glycosyltransferase involved in cell wall biosynthesis
MPVFLGEYDGCAQNRNKKFVRAVKSFEAQGYMNKKLIIVADGCDVAETIYNADFKNNLDIIFIKIEKQPLFSGNVRQTGLSLCSGGVITYLDSDDMFRKKTHLSIIAAEMSKGYDWIYFDNMIGDGVYSDGIREAALEVNKIGTSNIAHKAQKEFSWDGLDGYGHDWFFVQKLMKSAHYSKIYGAGYGVCHFPHHLDC